ncbi:hypothetical protein [Qipengyuania sp. JC766]|uniref:hypothetical protein n=1 Tax=Qipengyuania sp. JC766 TaxID=3232139 RepID=UPI00345845CB
MSQTFEFYDARAREAADAAGEASLQNVRDKNLRAEKTWRALADQAQQVAEERARTARVKESVREAEAGDPAAT